MFSFTVSVLPISILAARRAASWLSPERTLSATAERRYSLNSRSISRSACSFRRSVRSPAIKLLRDGITTSCPIGVPATLVALWPLVVT